MCVCVCVCVCARGVQKVLRRIQKEVFYLNVFVIANHFLFL